MQDYLPTATRLHNWLIANHWNGQGLIGPDPGVRLNYRIGRFVKSYLSSIKWQDDLYYLQAQAYWVLSNWVLFSITREPKFREVAIQASLTMLEHQRPDGAWEYPNPEWKGRIATTEGSWASIGLLESYRHTQDPRFLDGVFKWHQFLIEVIQFRQNGDELAINYFAEDDGDRTPNNSITVLRFLAELAEATQDQRYLEPANGILNFLLPLQQENGEIPYLVEDRSSKPTRPHFQCYQYNAFELLNLARYYELTADERVLPLIMAQARFLSGGLADDGHAYYDCDKEKRRITYHTTAVAAALHQASQLGLSTCKPLAQKAFYYILNQQLPQGNFIHSQYDYGFLTDRRSYPRYQAMMLYHWLHLSPQLAFTPSKQETALAKG